MFTELGRVIDELRKEKGIDREVVIKALEEALLKVAKNKYGHNLAIEACYNEELGEVELFQFKTVVEHVVTRGKEVTLEEAKKIDPEAEMGDSLGIKMDTSLFGRIAAQTAKQVIVQSIREAERENVYIEFKDKKGDMVTGIVQRFDKGDIIVALGKSEAILPIQEQIPSDKFSLRERIKAYIVDVKKSTKGPQVILSRTHPGFLIKLFELEVPEITEGIVKIRSVAREPGGRAKIAVESSEPRVDPVGACVGNRGTRVQNVVHELRGEKIDIIPWTADPAKFACSALAPAEISEILVDEEAHTMEVIVEDNQLSLAIGKKGQNVRLAAKLTKWKIDIKSRTKYEGLSQKSADQLTEISGIGKSTAEILVKENYLTAQDIIAAKLEDLVAIPGIGEKKAKKIKEAAKLALQKTEQSEP
ncbi:MAG: transcription termination factor NusA [Proteobacteria bacterium]|nr:transcription termination factor NusA [Pseudomonadota bacterium]